MNDFQSYIFMREERDFSPYAAKSSCTKGRQLPTQPCALRTEYARDRDRIIHSKAFRRLKHKTQVFLSPEGDHYRTRLTHTLEVSQIARSIARGLRLNEDLTEAIALGHDLGHTPYGHAGERALSSLTHFAHNEQSLRVVDVLENDGKGMNLTFEVRDGILNHTSKGNPSTLEGRVVFWADRIAYINHDIDDAVRGGIISESDIPKEFIDGLGAKHGQRINCMILDIIHNSFLKPQVVPTKKIQTLMDGLREFLFNKVYKVSAAKTEEGKAIDMIKFLYRYYYDNFDQERILPKFIADLKESKEQRICDYISMFSDRYAVRKFKEITVPKSWDL